MKFLIAVIFKHTFVMLIAEYDLVHHCLLCDILLFFKKEKIVLVLGNKAMQEHKQNVDELLNKLNYELTQNS